MYRNEIFRCFVELLVVEQKLGRFALPVMAHAASSLEGSHTTVVVVGALMSTMEIPRGVLEEAGQMSTMGIPRGVLEEEEWTKEASVVRESSAFAASAALAMLREKFLAKCHLAVVFA